MGLLPNALSLRNCQILSENFEARGGLLTSKPTSDEKFAAKIWRLQQKTAFGNRPPMRYFIALLFIFFLVSPARAIESESIDSDGDGLTDALELAFGSDQTNTDSDNDGYADGLEVKNSYSPVDTAPIKLPKKITVDLSAQRLSYFLGHVELGNFLISSGVPKLPTPKGEFTVLAKKPTVNYGGPGYSYPNTKWNLMFKKGKGFNYYIHGAYWHNKFGKPMSHGCVNVSYANMEGLYQWADKGTKVVIK